MTEPIAEATAVLQRMMARMAAVLMLLSLLIGGLAAGAMTGTIPADGKMLLAVHVTGLLGTFFIISVAWTLPMLRYSDKARARLCWLVILGNYANVIIGTAKSPFAVHGIAYTDSSANNVAFILLNVFVVTPTLLATIAWAWGLRGRSA